LPIIHRIDELYKVFYNLKKSINKADRYGICLKIEEIILEISELAIEAALTSSTDKSAPLRKLRIKIEVAKRLIRLTANLKIIIPKKYIDLETNLQEISKMATGWQKYAINKES